jgi:poly-gamma-glutamate capsule biosynthesis protein CapA/YwtB (metallophosphatase superfamily)
LDNAGDNISDRNIIFTAAGDCFLEADADDTNPFTNVAEIFQKSDISFLNVETVISDSEESIAKKWVHIKAPTESTSYLESIDIDIVNLAHNHIKDYGKFGFNDTLENLDKANLSYIGVGSTQEAADTPITIIRNGLKIAVVGYYQYSKSEPENEMYIASLGLEDFLDEDDYEFTWIDELKQTHDLVVVSLHWGYEHILHPSPGQIKYARSLIDNGTSLVIGHHPHCVQGVEEYKDGLIAYSLGNFNFWQKDVEPSWINRLSVILEVELSKKGVVDFKLIPIKIDRDYKPNPIIENEYKNLALDHFNSLNISLFKESLSWLKWHQEFGPIFIPQTLKSFWIGILRYGFTRFRDMIQWSTRRFTLLALCGYVISKFKRKTAPDNVKLKDFIEI